MKTETTLTGARVIGLDAHPDSFTAALLQGPTPAAAIVEKTFDKVPIGNLVSWAKKHTTPQDQIVLEASGNSFAVVRTLASVERSAKVLESCQMGKLKEAHANNDKISAVRIGKAYLAGTAKEVWVPDPLTQERRDWFHAHRKATARLTQLRARLRSYLSDNGVRLPQAVRLTQGEETKALLSQTRSWSPRQWAVIEGLLLELGHADQQRRHWRSLIAQEVLSDPDLLALVRLCGVREMIAFALGAFIGKIDRFAHPKKLVKYVGLNPAFDDSGEGQWSGGIGGHGHKWLRCLLMEGAQAILRSSRSPLAQWGKKLMGRKGQKNLAVAAVARKLTVSVWYLMKGRWTPLEEVEASLALKVGKIIGQVKPEALRDSKQTAQSLREQAYQFLKSRRVEAPVAPASAAVSPKPSAPQLQPPKSPLPPSRPFARTYILDPHKMFTPKAKTAPGAVQEGGR